MDTLCPVLSPFSASSALSRRALFQRFPCGIHFKIFKYELSKSRTGHGYSGSRIQASSAVNSADPEVERIKSISTDIFACPVCYTPLIRKGPPGLGLSSISESGFQCEKCNKRFLAKDVYLDLTITSSSKEYAEPKPVSMETFRNPFVSFVYERGWRQSMERTGFPGPDEEFRMAQKFLEPSSGGLLIDASCGSGLFSRRFVSSGVYSGVIALDFSENMLRQCYAFIKEDKSISTDNFALVRADISRLPFPTNSVDAVHAGAALHCWPSPSIAVAEVSRVLKPGGVFVATTVLLPGILGLEIVRQFRRNFQRAIGNYTFFVEEELKDLCKICGFVDYSCIRRRQFIMLCTQKPK